MSWAIVVVLALSATSCCAAREQATRSLPEPCPLRPELPDELDANTGLAPIPRYVAGGDTRPSGNIYWRQMRAVRVGQLQGIAKLAVSGDSACTEMHRGEFSCFRLPYLAYQDLALDVEPVQLVTPLPANLHETVLHEARPPVPDAVRAAFSSACEVAQLEAGPRLACARCFNGSVQCLSTEPVRTPASASDFPRRPTLIHDVAGNLVIARDVSVGGSACAISSDAHLLCWGHIAQAALFPACTSKTGNASVTPLH